MIVQFIPETIITGGPHSSKRRSDAAFVSAAASLNALNIMSNPAANPTSVPHVVTLPMVDSTSTLHAVGRPVDISAAAEMEPRITP